MADKPKTTERINTEPQCLLERGYPRGEQIECGICDFRKQIDGKLICSKFDCTKCREQIRQQLKEKIEAMNLLIKIGEITGAEHREICQPLNTTWKWQQFKGAK